MVYIHWTTCRHSAIVTTPANKAQTICFFHKPTPSETRPAPRYSGFHDPPGAWNRIVGIVIELNTPTGTIASPRLSHAGISHRELNSSMGKRVRYVINAISPI